MKAWREMGAAEPAGSFHGAGGTWGAGSAGGTAGTCPMARVWQSPGALKDRQGPRGFESSSVHSQSARAAEFTRWSFLHPLPVDVKRAGQECGSTGMVCVCV